MQVAHTCESHGAAGCEVYPFDLLKTDQIDSLAKKVLGNRQVDVLVNNAGIMVAGSAHQGKLQSGMHISSNLVSQHSCNVLSHCRSVASAYGCNFIKHCMHSH